MLARITQGQALDARLYSGTTANVLLAVQPFRELGGGLNPFHLGIVSHGIRFASQFLGLKLRVWIAV